MTSKNQREELDRPTGVPTDPPVPTRVRGGYPAPAVDDLADLPRPPAGPAPGAGGVFEYPAEVKLGRPDMVNHPPHYNAHPSGIECIDVVEHMSFNLGNAVKYLWRADLKNGVEDLRKAAWYIDREIARLGRDNGHGVDT